MVYYVQRKLILYSESKEFAEGCIGRPSKKTYYMNKHQSDFLNLVNLPARFTAQQTAWYLGFQLHEIPILAKHRLLIPIADPAPNAPKFYLKCELDTIRNDKQWQMRARKFIALHWFGKNNRKKTSSMVNLVESSKIQSTCS
jgi:hypothetical protein